MFQQPKYLFNMKMICKKIPLFNHERFLSKIRELSNGCWLWAGALHRPSGYGSFGIKKEDFKPHRLSYDLFVGIKENTTVIDHICMNKLCVNPEHLREVTVQINTLENSKCSAVAKKAQTHCIRGHEFTDKNTIKSFGKYGGLRRNCRICATNTKKEWYERNKK